MAAINLRQDKERPLTIEEVDSNFDSLNREVATKLDTVAFNADNILDILDGNAGAGSTLDADKVHGKFPNNAAVPNTVVTRDSQANVYANSFNGLHVGDVVGDMIGTVTGSLIGNSTNVDGVIQIDHGGTGAQTSAAARTNLGLGSMSTQNKNAIDITGGTVTGITDLAIEDGGTGASNKEGARANLGLVIGSDVQAYSAILSGISGASGQGFVIRTSTNSSVTRKFVQGNSIGITNTDGVGGDLTISLSLSPTVTDIIHTGTNGSGNIGSGSQRFATVFCQGVSAGTSTTAPTGEIYATGNVTAYYSDDNLKTRLGNIENALDKIDQLQGFYYEANETAQALGYEVKREVGLSAQDTKKILPEIVKPAPIDNKYLTIDYERFAPLLVEGIKELRAELKAIKNQIGMQG